MLTFIFDLLLSDAARRCDELIHARLTRHDARATATSTPAATRVSVTPAFSISVVAAVDVAAAASDSLPE